MNFLFVPWSILICSLDWSEAALLHGEHHHQDSTAITAPGADNDITTGIIQPFPSDVHVSLGLPRELQGVSCGPFQCTTGAICLPSADGTDQCACDTGQGWMNDPAISDSWGYRSCVHRDECLDKELNRCADIPGSCVNLPPGPTPGEDQYKCICPQFYVSDDAFPVDPLLGPLNCLPVDFCEPVGDAMAPPCLPGQDCASIVGGFTCVCTAEDDELLESGECRSSVVAASSSALEVCGSDTKPCDLAGQFCEDGTNNCLCRNGWIQPAGEGGVCQERQECDLKLDIACDQTGRGTTDAVSECIETTIAQNPRGYKCRCLVEEGFIAAPNVEDGTNCIVAPTVSPSAAPSESVQPSGSATEAATAIQGPLPFCDRVACGFGRFCSAERRRCECLRGFVEVAPGPVCKMEQCGVFTSIAASPNDLSDLLPPNDCDLGCTQTVTLGFDFPWQGAVFSNITVTSNGNIWLGGGISDPGCCSADPIKLEGNSEPAPRIAVAHEDLDPAAGGVISVDIGAGLVVVSWEGVDDLNFQAVLHDDGTIDMRWGSGNPAGGQTIVAGLEDDPNGVAVPAVGAPFGAGGQTSPGEWPTNQCRRFIPTSFGNYCQDVVPGSQGCPCHIDFIPPGTDYSTLSCCPQCGENKSCQVKQATGFLGCVCNAAYTVTPSTRPVNDCGAFASISSFGCLIDGVTDENEGSSTVELRHDFPWGNTNSFSTITARSDGEILLGADIPGGSYREDFIKSGGSGPPRIAVAYSNFNPANGGDVYAAFGSEATVVSWEEVPFFTTNSGANFQVVLYADGVIDLRWGNYDGTRFGYVIVAGLEDAAISLALPATGEPFTYAGAPPLGKFPTNSCRRFVPDGAGSYNVIAG